MSKREPRRRPLCNVHFTKTKPDPLIERRESDKKGDHGLGKGFFIGATGGILSSASVRLVNKELKKG